MLRLLFFLFALCPSLFAADVGETKDLIGQHPEVAQRLSALAERMREDIGDSATNQKGKNRRPVGRVPASGQ